MTVSVNAKKHISQMISKKEKNDNEYFPQILSPEKSVLMS